MKLLFTINTLGNNNNSNHYNAIFIITLLLFFIMGKIVFMKNKNISKIVMKDEKGIYRFFKY